ncbi:FxsA family protein [Magnetospirillum sulfuroxidans]|uniref:FxsA family protein n=1 Tax=Magnetospirillum sulfuroxidans TaxID=611300 RepID=A0ABS5IE81_9PROT|nr:FxsA family protein [Magnetospirillum sulfuroxidans]MBR9972734.1 FxsA family protein [Magnetospirillum sulfuroxidans]
MAWLLIVAVIAIPVAEIAVFIKTAQWVGLLAAVLLAVVGALVGLMLVRAQGLRTMMRAKTLIDRGEMPVMEMFDGLCVALAGGLLILPGFLSDGLALLLLLPPVRGLLKLWLARHFVVAGPPQSGPTIIDGDYHVVEPDDQRIGRD